MRTKLVICLALLAAACGAPGSDGAPEGVSNDSLLPIYTYGWNNAWDRIDPGPTQGMSAIASNGSSWDLVYIGPNGHMYDRTSSDGVHFGAPTDLGDGTFTGAPAAVYFNSGLAVVGVHYDGSVSARLRLSQGTWYDWANLKGYIVGGGVAVAATGWSVHIFGVGGDGALWENRGTGGFWDSNWTSRGGKLAPVAPAAVSWGGQRIDVLAADPSMTPWHEWEDNGTFGGWESLGGKMQGQGAVASYQTGRLDFFVIGTDNAVYQKSYSGSWHDWSKIVGCANRFGAAAVAPQHDAAAAASTIDLYVLGMDHNAIWHDRYSTSPSSAAGPQPFCCGLANGTCCPAGDQPYSCLGEGGQNVYCNPADNKCEQCGTAVGEACCSLVDALGARPMCSYYGSTTVCNIYSNRCDSSGGPAGGAYQLCKAGGVCDAGNSCVGRNVDRDIAGYCKPNPQPACGAANASCSSNGNCCSGLVCIGGKCAQPSTAKTCGGNPVGSQTQAYLIGVRVPGSLCAATEVAPYANSQAEAQGCVQKLYPGYDLLPGKAYSYYDYAENSPFGTCEPLQVPAFSQSDADTCAQSQCLNCSDTRNGVCQ